MTEKSLEQRIQIYNLVSSQPGFDNLVRAWSELIQTSYDNSSDISINLIQLQNIVALTNNLLDSIERIHQRNLDSKDIRRAVTFHLFTAPNQVD